jgi:HIV Tat-specific factor 1
MNGRFFAGRKVEAQFLTGKPNYKRSGKEAADDDNDEEEKQRLDQFAKWLETDKPATN